MMRALSFVVVILTLRYGTQTCPNESSFHFKVLSNVSEYCQLEPVANISESGSDEILDRIYVSFGQSLSVGAEHRPKPDWPLTLLETNSKWCQFKKKFKLKRQNIFQFKRKATFRRGSFVGFNQIWLGCPQGLCFLGPIDAVFYKEKRVHVLRGYYSYPLGSNAGKPETLRVAANAALSFNEERLVLFVEGSSFLLMSESSGGLKCVASGPIKKSLSPQTYAPFPENFPQNIDSLALQQVKSQTFIFVFKDNNYWKATYTLRDNVFKGVKAPTIQLLDGYPRPVSDISPLLLGADEVFFTPKTNSLMVFKKWFYFETALSGWIDETLRSAHVSWRYTHIKLFGCKEREYLEAGFSSHHDFAAQYLGDKTTTVTRSPKRTTEGKRKDNSGPYFPFLQILCAIMALLILLLLIYGAKIYFAAFGHSAQNQPKANVMSEKIQSK